MEQPLELHDGALVEEALKVVRLGCHVRHLGHELKP